LGVGGGGEGAGEKGMIKGVRGEERRGEQREGGEADRGEEREGGE